MAKNPKPATKKQALRAGRTLAGRVLANRRSTLKDKRLAASVLSQAARKNCPNWTTIIWMPESIITFAAAPVPAGAITSLPAASVSSRTWSISFWTSG